MHCRRAITVTAPEILRSAQERLLATLRQFPRRQCFSHAASLTFATLFAAVPFTAVTYAVLSVMPGFEGIADALRGFVFEHFVPESAGRIEEVLVGFADQARNLTLVGVVLLFVSTIMLMMSVEHAFNSVWGVTESRRGWIRLVGYWGLITLGPLLIGIGFLTSSYLTSLPLLTETGVEPLRLTFVSLLPELFLFLAISLLYYAVPNCHVPPRHALAGGLLATLLFELAEAFFTSAMNLGNLNMICGALAVLPLFFLWVYLVWSIVLSVAIVVAGFSPDEDRDAKNSSLLLKCLRVLELVAMVHPKGCLPRELARQADLTRSQWSEALDELTGLDLLAREGHFLVLGDAFDGLPLSQLYKRFPSNLSLAALNAYPGRREVVEPLIRFVVEGDALLSQPIRLSPPSAGTK